MKIVENFWYAILDARDLSRALKKNQDTSS